MSMLLAVGVAIVTIGSASADPSIGDWQKLRDCESGGNYATNTGNGYYGAYQFDLGTWQSVGGSGLPSDASPATQDALAYSLWQQQGWSPWACASIVGLPAGGSGGPAPALAPRAAVAPVPVNQAGRLQWVTYDNDSAKLVVTGWAVDRNSAGAQSSVRVTVDGVATDAAAATGNPAAPVAGSHGFAVSIPATAGLKRVCLIVLPLRSSPTVSLGCMNTVVRAEIRNRQSIKVSHGRVQTSGWVYDNTSTGSSNRLVISINAAHYKLVADQSSFDVDRAFGISGSHRFAATHKLTRGRNIVCIYAIGANPNNVKRLECRTVIE